MNLQPVRDALLAGARRDAEELRAAAERDAAGALAGAQREAERLMAAARAEGEAEARRVAAKELARARREARQLVLAARCAAGERLAAEARRAASDLRHTPGYRELLDGLARLARTQLGGEAIVVVDEEVGGLVSTLGSRSVDYRLPAVASRCLAQLAGEVDALWR